MLNTPSAISLRLSRFRLLTPRRWGRRGRLPGGVVWRTWMSRGTVLHGVIKETGGGDVILIPAGTQQTGVPVGLTQ